jgi:Icc protein
VLVSGDLADNAADTEYEQVRELLAPLRAPIYVLPGNHDDRCALHRHFGVPGVDGEPVQYAVDLGPLRLVVLDTTRPGEDPGALDAERLGWLDAELATTPEVPTLLAMHHPPLSTGVRAWDELGLPVADRWALGEVVERHPQVRRIVAGHVHRTMTAERSRSRRTDRSEHVRAGTAGPLC